jgi:hypothetical protein
MLIIHKQYVSLLLLLLVLRGRIAQGVPYTATIYDLLCISIWVLFIPDSSTIALWELRAETPSSEAGETWQEMEVHFYK